MREIIEWEKVQERQCCVVSIKWLEGMLQSIKGTGVQVNVLQVDKRPRVLDLFCGTGSWDGPFRKLGWEVHTLDINPTF